MNPLTNMKNVQKLSERELQNIGNSSWHDQYRGSAWIFVGGLPYDLSEGDIICIFSQYGEIVNINLIRAKDTGKSKGFCFLCYEDQRSTVLAVDNFNGIRILNRTIRVDHVQEYKVPKEGKKTDEETKKLYIEGCAPKAAPIVLPKIEKPPLDLRETIADQIEGELKLPARLPIYTNIKKETDCDNVAEQPPKDKKKKKKSKKSKKKKRSSSDSDSDSSHADSDSGKRSVKVKKEKRDRSRSLDRERTKNDKKSLNRRERSKSKEKETEEKPKWYSKDVTPNIPKRWR